MAPAWPRDVSRRRATAVPCARVDHDRRSTPSRRRHRPWRSSSRPTGCWTGTSRPSETSMAWLANYMTYQTFRPYWIEQPRDPGPTPRGYGYRPRRLLLFAHCDSHCVRASPGAEFRCADVVPMHRAPPVDRHAASAGRPEQARCGRRLRRSHLGGKRAWGARGVSTPVLDSYSRQLSWFSPETNAYVSSTAYACSARQLAACASCVAVTSGDATIPSSVARSTAPSTIAAW
jgi:hypothetical protein